MTYDEAIAFWHGRINYEVRAAEPSDLKLERMQALLQRLGDPHDRVRLVHVTGTKGKGSTSAMIAAVLRASGYSVGLFTSPHLSHIEERIQIDGEPISHEELATLMTEIAPVVQAMEEESKHGITFFEIGTLLGFLHFCRRQCEVAVIEVGLGGRFDSTNVCHPLVSVITNVGFDHTAQLGTTLDAIAYQKAGIIKRGVPVVSGVTQDKAREVVRRVAAEQAAPLWEMREDYGYDHVQDTHGTRATIDTPCSTYPWLTLNLLGEHQAANAATAVAAIDVLRERGFTISVDAVTDGLQHVRWPARIELVSERPIIILDTAHNVPSAEALVRTLRESFSVTGRKFVVFAVSSDKQYTEILRILAGFFDHFHLTQYGNNPRCVPPEKLAATLDALSAAFTIHPNSADAWTTARAAASSDELLCVTGSVFLAGELQPLLVGSR